MFWNKIKCRIRLETIQEHPEVNAPILLLWLIDLIKLFRIAIPLPNHQDLSSLIHPVLSRYVPSISSWYNIHPPFHSIPAEEYPFQLPHLDSFTKNPSFSFVRSTDWLDVGSSHSQDWMTDWLNAVLYSNSSLALNCHCAWTVSWRLMLLMVFPANPPSMKDSQSHSHAVSITLLLAHTTSEAREWYSR